MRTLVAGASLVVVVGLAAPAQADPLGSEVGPDGYFLSALNEAGVPYKSGPVAISVGKRACELMDQGHSLADVIQSLAASNLGYTADSATKFAAR